LKKRSWKIRPVLLQTLRNITLENRTCSCKYCAIIFLRCSSHGKSDLFLQILHNIFFSLDNTTCSYNFLSLLEKKEHLFGKISSSDASETLKQYFSYTNNSFHYKTILYNFGKSILNILILIQQELTRITGKI